MAVQKESLDTDLNMVAICLYLIHDQLWCLVDYGLLLQIRSFSQGEHVRRGSITLCP